VQRLSRYINIVESGSEIIITHRGKPVTRLSAITPKMAMKTVTEHQFSFWDAMILETAAQAGVTHLYSEDMQHKQSWKSTIIENPFL